MFAAVDQGCIQLPIHLESVTLLVRNLGNLVKINAFVAALGALLIAVLTTALNNTVNKWLDRPATITAEIDWVPFVSPIPGRGHQLSLLLPDFNEVASKLDPKIDRAFLKRILERVEQIDRAQIAGQGQCAHFIRLENNTPRPAKDIKISGENITGFSLLEEGRYAGRHTAEVKVDKTYILENLEPGASRVVVAYSTLDCASEYGWHDKLRIFNSEGMASIRTISLPRGFMAFLNEYWYATYFLTAIGSLVVFMVFFAIVFDLLVKLKIIEAKAVSGQTKKEATSDVTDSKTG